MLRHPILTATAILLPILSSPSAFAQEEGEANRPVMTEEVRAQSRYVWIEDSLWIEPVADTERLVLRYGRKGQRLETSPGALDRLPATTVWVLLDDRVEPLALKKSKDGFHIAETTSAQSVQAEDSAVSIRNNGTRLARKPVLYARWLPDLAPIMAATLTLDILPIDATHFKIMFRDAPLPGAKLQLITADNKHEKLIADDKGVVEVAKQQTGTIQLLCGHSEVLAVHVNGEAYKGTRHVTTVTWKAP